jgi:Ni/Fe-hydrogenase subunit HybB-like protein
MRSSAHVMTGQTSWFNDKILMGLTPGAYVRSLFTPFNVVAGLILAVGIPVIVYRFAYGLGAATNLTQETPWGIWIGVDMLCGVALAAGGFSMAATVYVFGLKDFHPIVRPAVLTAFLGYLFAVLGLMCDLGRPWNLPVPMIYSFGTTSVMFEVGWCVMLYTTVLALEFSPALFEWLGIGEGIRRLIIKATMGLTVAAVMLSTLHQSSLGALFLMAPTKIHPLWYSPFIPAFFFISAIAAGLSMVIVESTLSHRAFQERVDHDLNLDKIAVGLARAGAVVLFAYFFLKLQGVADGGNWALLATPMGYWFLFEVVGFVLIPSFLFAHGARTRNTRLITWTAAWTVLGVVVNRVNVSVVAFNWNVAHHYVPSWMEVATTLTLITTGVLCFRWIVNRMPILRELPQYRDEH